MNDILHANIFFYIASVATIVFAVFVCVLIYTIIRIARIVLRITERIDAKTEMFAEDISRIRARVVQGGLYSLLVRIIASAIQKNKTNRRREPKEKEE